MLVETSLVALAAGQQITVSPGDTIRVSVSFVYTVPREVTVSLWGSVGYGVIRQFEDFKDIVLGAAVLPKTIQESIDIQVPATWKDSKTYWLQAEIKGYPNTQKRIEDAVVISVPSGGIGGIMDILPMIMTLMVLGMIMPMMTSMTKGGKEETE